ncbi:hypothetical protein D3C85_973370 [compost metagenome]
MFQKAKRRIDLDLASLHVGFVHHPPHAAVVVHVAVGIDHSDYRLLGTVLIIEIQRRLGRFGGNQRVHDRQAFLAFDDGHVGQVQVAHLVDAVSDLKQTRDIQKLRLAPQAGVDGVWRIRPFLDEVVLARIPHQVALGTLDHRSRQGRNETLVGQLERGLVGERKFFQERGIRCLRGGFRGLGRLRRPCRGRQPQREGQTSCNGAGPHVFDWPDSGGPGPCSAMR